MAEIKNFQSSYAKKAIQFWMERPYVLHAMDRFARNPYAVEAHFEYEVTETFKDVCFDLTDRLHDYDNDLEVRTGRDLTHRILYLCASSQEADKLALDLGKGKKIRIHKLY